MTQADLHGAASILAAGLPSILTQADQLAATLVLGEHGRRRSGSGDAFWQFRPAAPGDSAQSIDWRRSAQADEHFLRETEWQAAQTVQFWVDNAASMDFASVGASKANYAQVLALATAILLIQAGERVGSTDGMVPPRPGRAQVEILANHLITPKSKPDFGKPDVRAVIPNSTVIFMSDFLGDIDEIAATVTDCANRGTNGILIMVLDPQEMSFPFNGRTIFESMAGGMQHETQKAGDLREKYQQKLNERIDLLADLSRLIGWRHHVQVTDRGAQSALLWLHQSLGRHA